MITDKSEFRWLIGEEKIKTWHKSAHDWACSFCVECGSSLPGENDPERMYVPVGLIDNADLEGVRVAHHLWVDSKAPWDEITDDGEQHRQGIG
ncbi:GFA family protein [Pseudoalteromonas sp. SMS1]|nr:GFA family protein [Pseudoalteromonas sp. SMS1]